MYFLSQCFENLSKAMTPLIPLHSPLNPPLPRSLNFSSQPHAWLELSEKALMNIIMHKTDLFKEMIAILFKSLRFGILLFLFWGPLWCHTTGAHSLWRRSPLLGHNKFTQHRLSKIWKSKCVKPKLWNRHLSWNEYCKKCIGLSW